MPDIIETLVKIRDDYTHERNAFQETLAAMGDVAKYARRRAEAQSKIDAIDHAICVMQQVEMAHA